MPKFVIQSSNVCKAVISIVNRPDNMQNFCLVLVSAYQKKPKERGLFHGTSLVDQCFRLPKSSLYNLTEYMTSDHKMNVGRFPVDRIAQRSLENKLTNNVCQELYSHLIVYMARS